MSDLNRQLTDLHTYLLRVRDLKRELEEGGKHLLRFKAKVDHAAAQAQAHADKIKGLKKTLQDREVSFKANVELIKKYERQRANVTVKKEYDALGHEIDNTAQANNVLEEEMLGLMEQLEAATKQIPQFDAAVAQAKETLANAEKKQIADRPLKQARLEEAERLIQESLSSLPDDLRTPLSRRVAKDGAEALATVHGRSCGGCNTEVTPQMYNNIQNGRAPVCQTCSRVLYLAVEPG